MEFDGDQVTFWFYSTGLGGFRIDVTVRDDMGEQVGETIEVYSLGHHVLNLPGPGPYTFELSNAPPAGALLYPGYWSFYADVVGQPLVDTDGDGILDVDDACPTEDASGYDANQDGCIDSVEDLIWLLDESGLPHGITQSLLAKVEGAIDSIDDGHLQAAVNKLEAFIDHVNAQSGKSIPADLADLLITCADNVLNVLAWL